LAERDPLASGDGEGERPGLALHPARAPRIARSEDDIVGPRAQVSGRDAVLALGAPAMGHPERAAVDPGRVEVVDDADVELAAGRGLFGGQLERAAEPDVADRRGRAFAPGGPRADARDRAPVERARFAPRL